MKWILTLFSLLGAVGLLPAEIIIAEGERFTPLDKNGWRLAPQDESYGSHTYGGMWMTHGACLLAPAEAKESVAEMKVTVPAAGKYRVWSKYQAPPYFNYQHQVEVLQGGKSVFKHVYGKKGTPNRFWSFSAVSDECWWPWGVDHDCAESPTATAELTAGPAVIRLTAIANPKPAGNRCVDFVILTTKLEDSYEGFKPYQVGSPFVFEALAATKLYLRFKNTGDKPAVLNITRAGHFQPQYGGATMRGPAKPVDAGQTSEWIDIGPFVRLVHDEGLKLNLGAGKDFSVQFAREGANAEKEIVGDMTLQEGDWAVVPLEITWKKDAVVKPAKQHAQEIVAASKTWRRSNGGRKPKEIAFYGSFIGPEDWVDTFKDALGYNTLLPDKYDHLKRDGLYAHAPHIPAIQKLAETTKDKDKMRVISFGDEISLGSINYKDPKLNAKFVDWLKAKKLTKIDLGVEPADAKLTNEGRLAWHSNLFNEEERFAAYRAMTDEAKKLFGPQVLTGANYSPHHLALCYGPIYQWVDIFKHQGMSMFWAEDYIFSVPEAPQILSWMFAQMRCATKYHNQPIHMYVMPHAPGQDPAMLRRNTLLSLAFGAKHIDNFWVGPAERFTENYVSWNRLETFQVLSEAMFDCAEVEKYLTEGKLRPAKIAVITGKATDFNESRLMVDKTQDPFAKDCQNAPTKLNQILCRKEQQMLYLSLMNTGVDVITEDDIVDSDVLKQYQFVYFAGEWVDQRIFPKLDRWVSDGGTLYACAGLGIRNQYDEPESGMLKLLGLKEATLKKNAVVIRTLLELPLLPSIGTLDAFDAKHEMVAMRQALTPDQAKVVGKWEDGSAAITQHTHGKGTTFAVGSMPGHERMKTRLKPIPWARGGTGTLYIPDGYYGAENALVHLPLPKNNAHLEFFANIDGVEAVVRDHAAGTLVTLVSWRNQPVVNKKMTCRVGFQPKEVRSIRTGKTLEFNYDEGLVTFTVNLSDADFIVIKK